MSSGCVHQDKASDVSMSGLTDDLDEERRGFRRGGRIVWGTFAVPSFLASPDSRAVALIVCCFVGGTCEKERKIMKKLHIKGN